MRSLTTMRLIPALLTLLISPVLAQEDKESSWTIRVAAVEIAGAHHTLWLRTGPGKDPVEVPLNIHSFSQEIKFKGLDRMIFYRSAEEAGSKEPPPPLATVALKAKSSLLVFTPREGGETYQAFSVSDSDFPFGSFRLVNFSKAIVRVELDSKAANLNPGASRTFAYRDAQDAIPVRILASANGKKPRIIRQSSWSIIPTQRELVFFFPNPKNGLVRFRHFVDSKKTTEASP